MTDHKAERRPKAYLAGPLGFSEPGQRFYAEVLLPAVAASGLEPLDPWANGPLFEAAGRIADATARRARFVELNRSTGLRNIELIRQSAIVFAVLDGADVDSGTAAEVGFAYGINRPVVAWRSDLRTGFDNEATIVNLQVQYFIEASGGAIETRLDDALALARRLVVID